MVLLRWFEDYGDEMFMNFNMSDLAIDQAYLHVQNNRNRIISMYTHVKECINCPFQYLSSISNSENKTLKVGTNWDSIYRFTFDNNTDANFFCELDSTFGQFGVYSVKLESSTCSVNTLKEAVSIYFPILTVFLIYLAIGSLITLGYYAFRKIHKKKDPEMINTQKKKERVKSLDTFRGLSITIMIFVNYGAGRYAVLEHAIWNGLHLADVVFPWFMWIMGVCIPISVMSILKRKVPIKDALFGILQRSCILFTLGLFLGASTNLNKLRIFGVLQRFGICYFVVTTLCLLILKVTEETTETRKGKLHKWFADILRIKYLWCVTLLILTSHCLILFLLSIPNCPKGYLGPGGSHQNRTYNGCTGGATGYIDRLILGNHAYRFPTCHEIYKSQAFDPEGILGCLTSIVQVFIGVQAGFTLLTYKDHKNRLLRWLIWAVSTGIIGGALCGFSKEGGVIPINKNIWSLSFVLVTSSFAFLLLIIFYILIDVKKYWSGKPLLFAGMNAILMYVGHSMTYNNFPVRWHLENNQKHFVELLENVWATSIWLLIAAYLYHKKYFFSV